MWSIARFTRWGGGGGGGLNDSSLDRVKKKILGKPDWATNIDVKSVGERRRIWTCS